ETEFDWLSVNRENIEKYLADDLCGFPFTVSAMQDLITLTARCNSIAWAKAMPKGLPVYLVAGDEDPVGAYGEGVVKVGFMLHRAGVEYAKFKLYRGYRHEILNEECKGEVCRDILGFAEKFI
ncbi:MAG: alpha/beta hydrolase, partial [Clostridia bacterium]|nr:alpha/beta hydrolase [Clostridia bacterium]